MSERLDWARDGADWPHRDASRFVSAGGLRWHVQQFGPSAGAAWLLIHGTGASTHSWRGVAPLLAARGAAVIAVDLPGHGFSSMPAAAQAMSLPGMAEALGALLAKLDVAPQFVLGHSAGVAIGAQLCLTGLAAPRALVGVNAALLPLHGAAGIVFSPLAKLMAKSAWVPRLFAWRAGDAAAVRRMIAGTGSTLDAEGLACYARLMQSPGHVAAALAMMANWDLAPLARALPRLQPPLRLLTGGNDRTLPPTHAERVAALVPAARSITLPGLGHLAHEEQPRRVADLVWQQVQESAAVEGARP